MVLPSNYFPKLRGLLESHGMNAAEYVGFLIVSPPKDFGKLVADIFDDEKLRTLSEELELITIEVDRHNVLSPAEENVARENFRELSRLTAHLHKLGFVIAPFEGLGHITGKELLSPALMLSGKGDGVSALWLRRGEEPDKETLS